MNVTEYVDNFGRRILQDAFSEATGSYWIRRAEAFERVGTPACNETARACRSAATLALWQDAAGRTVPAPDRGCSA